MLIRSQSVVTLVVGIVLGVTAGAVGTAAVYEHDWLAPDVTRAASEERPRPRPPWTAEEQHPGRGIEVVSLATLSNPDADPAAPEASMALGEPFQREKRDRAWARPHERELRKRLRRDYAIKPLEVECRSSCCRITLRREDWQEHLAALQTDLGVSQGWTFRSPGQPAQTGGAPDADKLEDEAGDSSVVICQAPSG